MKYFFILTTALLAVPSIDCSWYRNVRKYVRNGFSTDSKLYRQTQLREINQKLAEILQKFSPNYRRLKKEIYKACSKLMTDSTSSKYILSVLIEKAVIVTPADLDRCAKICGIIIPTFLRTEYFQKLSQLNAIEDELFSAIRQNNVSKIKDLLQNNARINSHNEDLYTPLMLAAQLGFPSIVELLLKQPGIEVNVFNRDQRTPLLLAVDKLNDILPQGRHHEYAQVIEILLNDSRVEYNVYDNVNQYPLYGVIRAGYSSLAHLLLQKPNIDTHTKVRNKYDSRNTCLRMATSKRLPSVISSIQEIHKKQQELRRKEYYENYDPCIIS